eukprot:1156667-Pelagomonas_calceolata.AAC.3
MGIRRITSSSPYLILVMRVERGLLKNASGASEFISVLDRMSMKVQSKLGGCMNAKTKPLKGSKVWGVQMTPPTPNIMVWRVT